MTKDIASKLTDREREVLGMLSEKSERIQRILAETKKMRVRKPSRSDVQKTATPEERRAAIRHEASRVNNVIVNDWHGAAMGINGPLPGLQGAGFSLLSQHPFGSTGFGIGTELHAPAVWIAGTTEGQESRTLVHGVTNRFLCPYSTQWADESLP